MSLEVRIKKQFEKFKLDVCFETEDGLTGLLGASGCGKSMTLKCIAGLITPDEGRIVLNGRILFDSHQRINLPPQKRHVGYLFQHYALFPNMTVAQNIAAGMQKKEQREENIQALIRAFCLKDLEQKYPRQLSGGQQQRVALARILASQPEALLLDEPFSALDSYLKWQVELELADRLTAFPGPVIFVTHAREEIYRLCTHVCVLNHGKSEDMQAVKQLFDAPNTLCACLLSGCKNVSAARAMVDGMVAATDWGIDLNTGSEVLEGLTHIGVRAHYVTPYPAPGDNLIACRVIRVVEDLFSTVVMLETPGGKEGFSLLRMELPKAEWAAVGDVEELTVGIPPRCLMLLKEG